MKNRRVATGLAFGLFASQVFAGFGVDASAGDRDAVQRGVQLAVAATRESEVMQTPPAPRGLRVPMKAVVPAPPTTQPNRRKP